MIRNLLILLTFLALLGCAAKPMQSSGPTAEQVVAGGITEGRVHWGGQIVAVTNLRDRTLVEVLAYPLAGNGRPLPEQPAEGRFLVEQSGFLEPKEYAVNRLLEVEGGLAGFAKGRVGEVDYRFPVVLAERLNLWSQPAASGRLSQPRVNFGVGVSNHGGGVGVGIGF